MPDKKTCFIIMPVSTPKEYHEQYKDEDHFNHVLSELFIPAIKEADYDPIPPIAKGSDLIHAEIIKNLETADLVLCDMSILNPNVFFEFGIRTALNKPVCVVKDHQTNSIPFDTGIINHHEYNCELHSWIVKSEIPKLKDHLISSLDRSNGQNNLWKYFGIKETAQLPEKTDDVSLKMDWMLSKFENLEQNIYRNSIHNSVIDMIRGSTQISKNRRNDISIIADQISDYLVGKGFPNKVTIGDSSFAVNTFNKLLPKEIAETIQMAADLINFEVHWTINQDTI